MSCAHTSTDYSSTRNSYTGLARSSDRSRAGETGSGTQRSDGPRSFDLHLPVRGFASWDRLNTSLSHLDAFIHIGSCCIHTTTHTIERERVPGSGLGRAGHQKERRADREHDSRLIPPQICSLRLCTVHIHSRSVNKCCLIYMTPPLDSVGRDPTRERGCGHAGLALSLCYPAEAPPPVLR